MKKTNKIISMLCVIAMLFSLLATVAVSAAEYVIEKPVEANKWENPHFDTDHAYSFAFVGDTQFITIGDYLLGTEKLKYQYKFIADTAEERKLEHVFVLGDMTDWGYRNDGNLAGIHYDPPLTGEWEIVKEAISQLDGVVPYSLVRGNHDDYMMDDYFNVPEYTSMFDGCGGFFVDTLGKQGGRERKNPDNCIYWSAKTGCHDESVVNSWKTVEISGTKYLFITYDYNPTVKVLNWLDEILAQYPDHKAIITTHSYMVEDGTLSKSEEGDTMYPTGVTAQVVWDRVLSKHSNVFMIVSGHTGNEYVNFSYQRGEKGNKVLQVLVDPQCYETREIDKKGTLQSGKQDVGLVLYMNFSADGQRISFDYYSTLLGKFLRDQDFVINLNGDVVDGSGYIDMASFGTGLNETPLITDMTTVTMDGVISSGEYASSRTYGKTDFAKGTLAGNVTEHFAYDNDYLYLALQVEGSGMVQNKIQLHFGSALYTREEMNRGDHNLYADFVFSNGKFSLDGRNTNQSSTPQAGDLFCSAVYDKNAKVTTYELKIRRGFLRDNGSPDNLLSYKLTVGSSENYYKLTTEDKEKLEELGIDKKMLWTYNYAYFGTRPEVADVPPIATEPPVTAPPAVTTAVATTEAPKSSGCGGTLTIAAVAMLPAIAGVALFAKKKNDD